MESKSFLSTMIVIVVICIAITVMITLISCNKKWQPKIQSDEDIKKVLTLACNKFNQPAMGSALIIAEETIYKAVSGTYLYKGKQEVDINSRFHIGSTTKSMTALLIALLVKEGKLSYDTTLFEILPEIRMLEDYKQVTIHDILINKAGIIPFQLSENEDPEIVKKMWDDIPKLYPEPQQQREHITKIALNLKPIAEPGTKVIYSNVGWAILGYIAEIITGVQFEELLKEKIFNHLKMDSAQIGGWPASKEEPDQPRGHYFKEEEEEKIISQALDDEYVFPDWMNPSGGVNLSIIDYAKYAKEHLLGLQGKGILLEQAEYEFIHKIHVEAKIDEMYQNIDTKGSITMGYGWAVVPVDSKNTLSAAEGSGGTFFARIIVFPLIDAAFVGFSNCGNGNAALDFVIERITGLKWGS